MESRFITDEKPARIMLLELQVKNSGLQQKLREANKELQALGQATSGTANPLPDPEIAELKRQLADAKAEIELLKREALPAASPPQEETSALKQQISELQKALDEAEKSALKAREQQTEDARLLALQQTNQQLQQQLDQIAKIVGAAHSTAEAAPLSAESAGIRLNAWHLPVLLLALLFSFIGGIAFKNYRLAKRYGGFRI